MMLSFDSFDSAEHSRNTKNSTSIISFNSQMLTLTMLNSGLIKAGSSSNSYTLQQLKGIEKSDLMFPAVKNYFNSKILLYDKTSTIETVQNGNSNGTKVSLYDLHTGKILYHLAQHSQWNQKYHPFLLCTCSRGDGVKDDEHTCTWLIYIG